MQVRSAVAQVMSMRSRLEMNLCRAGALFCGLIGGVVFGGCAWNDSPPPFHSVVRVDRNAWAKDGQQLAAEAKAVNITDWETNQMQGTSGQASGAGAATTGAAVGFGAGSSSSTSGSTVTGTATSSGSAASPGLGTGTRVGTGIAPGTSGSATGFTTPGVSSSSTGTGAGTGVAPLGSSAPGTAIANPGAVPGVMNQPAPTLNVPSSSTTTSTNIFGTPR